MVDRINKNKNKNEKKSILLVFLLFICLLSLGLREGFNHGSKTLYSLAKDGVRAKSRKLLVYEIVLDYNYAGPNPKHDPRKGKPPKNP